MNSELKHGGIASLVLLVLLLCSTMEAGATGEKKFCSAHIKTTMGITNDWKQCPDIFHADDYAICQTYVDLFRLTRDQRMIDHTIENPERFMTTPYPSKDKMRKISKKSMERTYGFGSQRWNGKLGSACRC